MLSFKSAGPRQIGNCLLADVGVNACNKQHLRLASYAVEFHEMVEALAEKEPDQSDWRRIDSLFSRISRFVAVHFSRGRGPDGGVRIPRLRQAQDTA